ncbi:MAG: ORF6N domain-containing protein [Candidatus Uhrbacteria bacterium]
MKNEELMVPMTVIEGKIFLLRGQKVMIDRDLAQLYGVSTMVLNQAVKRNRERFPTDFLFQLTKQEMEHWKSQVSVTVSDRMGLRKPFVVFTELGVAMLSSVLRSPRAIAVNIQIMRTFSRLREMLAENDDLRRKVEALEKQYDENFKIVFDAIRNMISDDAAGKSEIGFRAE